MMEKLETIVQNNIQYFRNKLGWSQEELAEKAGLSKIYLAEMESHKRKPSISMMEKLATALDIKAYLLMVKEPTTYIPASLSHDQLISDIVESIMKFKKL